MKLRDFGLLTDENLDPDVIAFLRQAGFDVFDVCENGFSAKAVERRISRKGAKAQRSYK